jgi:hypothetical protein
MAKSNPKPSGQLKIGGDVNTGGGDVAGGNIYKHDVIQSHGSEKTIISNEFKNIYQAISEKNDIALDDKEDLRLAVEEIENTVLEKDEKQIPFIQRRLRNIALIAPDIFDVVVKTLSNPIIGLSDVAKKIAQKAVEQEKKNAKLK